MLFKFDWESILARDQSIPNTATLYPVSRSWTKRGLQVRDG
jgi:hypothetical protein